MSKRTLLTQTKDNDDTRIIKLLEWAKSKLIWIHDDVIVGQMLSTRLESNSGAEVLDDTTRKRKERNSDIVDHAHVEKRQVTEEAKTEASAKNSTFVHQINGKEFDDTKDNDTEGTDDDYDERARGRGFGVYVKPAGRVLERQVVVLIPKSTMLSARTSSLSPHIAYSMHFSSDASSGLLLSLVLLHEFLLGHKGPWWGYLQSLPRQDDQWGIAIPLLLDRTSETWSRMDKTEVGRMVRRVEADPKFRMEGLGMSKARLEFFFNSKGLGILKQAHPEVELDSNVLLQDYLRLYSIISSRTFVVDMYHGMCLVPVADMFNHSEASNMHFEADDEVCDECGSLGSCPHNSDPLPSTAYGRPSAFLPAISGPNSVDWMPPDTLKDIDTVDMVAQKIIKGNDEAYNTYGNFSNANLLTTYGFCLEYETPWDRYVWDWRYKGEREELLQALDLSSAFQEDTTTAQTAWRLACSSFSELPLESFDELLIEHGKFQSDDLIDSSINNALPHNSPFVTLAKPIWDNEESSEEVTIEEIISSIIADLSNHYGTRDKYQPFFIDSEGRISVALFRAFVLAQYAIQQEKALSVERWSKEDYLAKTMYGMKMIEKNLAFIREQSEQADQSKSKRLKRSAEPDEHWAILESTIVALEQLVSKRLERVTTIVRQPIDGHPIDGIASILEKEPSLQRSAAIQAWQEFKALTICNENLEEYIKIIAEISISQSMRSL